MTVTSPIFHYTQVNGQPDYRKHLRQVDRALKILALLDQTERTARTLVDEDAGLEGRRLTNLKAAIDAAYDLAAGLVASCDD